MLTTGPHENGDERAVGEQSPGGLTDYHAEFFACDLTKQSASDSIEKLVGVLADAQVDLNPHQIEAANSLMELYGLVSIIDPYAFGDAKSFSSRFVRPRNNPDTFAELKSRLAPI